MKKFVFDSSALICYLDGEPNAFKVAELLEDINQNDYEAFLCTVNLGEVYYHFLRTGGEETADIVLRSVLTLPLNLISAEFELTLDAAKIKAFNKMSYADCFAAALAERNGANLVTGDNEFKQINNKINITWI